MKKPPLKLKTKPATGQKVVAVNKGAVTREVVAAMIAQAFAKATVSTPAPQETHVSDGREAVQIAAQNVLQPMPARPVPTAEQIQKCGGGIGGFLRATRALERGETI